MNLNIWNNIVDFFSKTITWFQDFIDNNYESPFMWLGIVFILVLITSYAISKLGNK